MSAAGPSIGERASLLVAARRFSEAYRLLSGTEAEGDPDVLFNLALWRLTGDIIARDLSASRELFRRAAEARHPDARAIYAALVANGVGGPPNFRYAVALLERDSSHDRRARAELELIARMRLSLAGDPSELPDETRLSERPKVSCFSSLFTEAECDFLIEKASPWLQPSVVIDPHSGRAVRHPIRTSDAMAFSFVAESPAIHALNRRIAAATATQPAQGEPLQILRYRSGQEYKPHGDALAGDPNQRIVTALVYLSEHYTGGETQFMTTGLRFKGKRGDALVFGNVTADGRPDPQAQHAGLPVMAGEKLVASRWIRAEPFLLPPPRPILDV